jgi:pimeloyl-ACP methyl ester carboxylesterase
VLVVSLTSCHPVAFYRNRLVKKLENHQITAHFIENENLKIKYWSGGNGPVLLFLHGFGGDALTTWKSEMLELCSTYTVVAPDLLWFGESYASWDANLESQTRAIEILLDELGADTISVIGQSYGGFIATDLLMKHPEMIKRLCIANSPGPDYRPEQLDTVCRSFGVNTIEELFIFEDPQMVQRIFNLASFKDRRIPKSVLNETYSLYFDQNHNELRQLMQTLKSEPIRSEVFNLMKKMDMMILWGEKDELFFLDQGKHFAYEAEAELIVIEGAGHAPQMDNPRRFTKEVASFFGTKD